MSEKLASSTARLDVGELPAQTLTDWLHAMCLIRNFEEALDPLSFAGKIPGGVHAAVGEEAVAIGTMRALEPQDVVATTHRSHHHALARGLEPRLMLAELFGRVGPYGQGRCGTMHLADFDRAYFGGNGIVGAGLGIAMGAALAANIRRIDQIAVGFVGDGGLNTGRTWETINLAALWKLPLVVVCENNLYAVETHIGNSFAGDSVTRRAEGFGLPAVQVDGQDVVAVFNAVRSARERAASGQGPTFIEMLTYRFLGHSTGEVVTYRTEQEVASWRQSRDPITRLADALIEQGFLSPAELELIRQSVTERIAEAIAFAEAAPLPDPSTAGDGVTEIIPGPKGVPWQP